MKTRQLTKDCKPIAEECFGCDKVFSVDGTDYCLAYADPSLFWKNLEGEMPGKGAVFGKGCALASHIKIEAVNTGRKRIGQQKHKGNK